MDEIFKALADPSRRMLLDALFEKDGQSLKDLTGLLQMTRFGVMKHLRVLEQAGLITTEMVGRRKLHYLNPMPLRLIFDRWTSKYAAAWTALMGEIKYKVETDMAKTEPKHVYEVYIRTSPEKLWQAITEPEFTRKFFYGTAVSSTFEPGADIAFLDNEGERMVEGEVVEFDPPKKLVHTFHACHDPEAKDERPSRVTWTIEPMGDVCKLTLVHDDFDGETATFKSTGPGWNPVLSGLKTLLETGQPLSIPMPSE